MASVDEGDSLKDSDVKDGPQSSNKTDNLAEFMTHEENATLEKVQDFFKTRNGVVDVNEMNKYGMTALMYACRDGEKEIVKFLLEKGANPNCTHPTSGETALHMACDYLPYDDGSGIDDEDEDNTSFHIAQLMSVEYDAGIKTNSNGLNPADLAALRGKLATVGLFLIHEWISNVEQIRAMELLGMKLAFDGKFQDAFKILRKAMKKRYENLDQPIHKDFVSDLEGCLGRRECQNLDDFKDIRKNMHAFKAEAFLIGDRILPNELKSEYLYEELVTYGWMLMRQRKTMPIGLEVLSGCLDLEKKGHLFFGSVLLHTRQAVMEAPTTRNLLRHMPQFLTLVCQILEGYVDVVRETSCAHLKSRVKDMIVDLALILFEITEKYEAAKAAEDFIVPIGKIITTTWSRIPKPVVDGSGIIHPSISVCHNVLSSLVQQFCMNYFFGTSRYERNRFKRLIARLLQIEGAQDVDCHGNTMMHTLMYLVSSSELDMVLCLAKLLLRHGCPTDVKNKDGKLPIDIARMGAECLEEYLDDQLEEVYGLLRGPTQIYSLQELCARAILSEGLPYCERLPESLWHLMKDDIPAEDEAGFQTPSDDGSDSSTNPDCVIS